jgi:hypothetical protein
VSGTCAYLHRAYRDLRFYPEGHPVSRQSLDSLVTRLQEFTDGHGSLTLNVEEDRLLYEGEQVYSYDASRDNLAFIMFRDGFRSLSFRPGVEATEVEAFVDLLAHADDLAPDEHDLVTALWEEDFTHIDYQLADLFLEGEVLAEGAIDDLRDLVLQRLEEVDLDGALSPDRQELDLRVVELRSTDAGQLALTAEELAQSEVVAGLPSTTLEEFAVVLYEILGSYPWPIEEADGLARALITVIASYLKSGDLKSIDFLLDRLKELEAQGRCSPGFVSSVVGGGVTDKGLMQLLEGVGRTSAVEMARIQEFLSTVRMWVLPSLLQLLADSPDRAVRRGLLNLLKEGGGVPGPLLLPYLRDSRWWVARNAVQLVAESRDETLIDELERLTRHPEVRVQREVVRALGALGGPRAVLLLSKALSSDDSSVRALAASGIGRMGGREHEALVLAQVNARDFESRPPEEIGDFLTALAALGKERAVPVLKRLSGRKMLGSRSMPVRVAAVKALATIPGPAAEAVLLEVSKSGRGQVQREAERALQEARAQRQRPQT